LIQFGFTDAFGMAFDFGDNLIRQICCQLFRHDELGIGSNWIEIKKLTVPYSNLLA